MPRKCKEFIETTPTLTKKGVPRKITRRKQPGAPIPKFVIDGKEYLSLYDIRNHLRERQTLLKQNLIYEFRKHKQSLERNAREDLLILERREFTVDPENQIHINANRSCTFVRISQVVPDPQDLKKHFFSYLVDEHQLVIEDRRIRVLRTNR